MSDLAFDVAGLSVRIGGKPILREITFALGTGRSLAIIGPNGAGKSTLLKSLGRIGLRAKGRIDVFGRPQRAYAQRALARCVSYVPQADGRTAPFTAFEFVLMARYPHLGAFAHLTHEDERIAREAMARTGVAEFATRRLDTLSGGERQKVYVAAALAQEARAILLDEPTTFLDYRHQAEILQLVRSVQSEAGLTVLTVMHDLNHGALKSDHVLALRSGMVAFWGTPGELIEGGRLEEVYETSFDVISHPETGDPIVVPARGFV